MIATLSVYAGASGTSEAADLAADARLKPWLTAGQRASLAAKFPSKQATALSVASENVRRLHAAGVPILAGTDAPNPGTAHGVSLHQELALLVRAGLTPAEALASATSIPAKIFSLKDRGWIVPGLRADLLLVDGDPTQDILATRAIVGIWKNGYAVDRSVPAETPAVTLTTEPASESALIADFEGSDITARYGHWQSTSDQLARGQSTVELSLAAPGAVNSKGALAIRGEIKRGFPWPWAGASFAPASGGKAVDYSKRKELMFRARGDGRTYNLLMFSGAATSGAPQDAKPFETTTDWREVRLPLSEFAQSDLSQVRAIAFTAGQPQGRFELMIDDVEIR